MALKPWEGPYSTTWGIRSTCDDVGITPGKKVFAEVYPCQDNSILHRIASHKDGTCIYVKRTIPSMPE